MKVVLGGQGVKPMKALIFCTLLSVSAFALSGEVLHSASFPGYFFSDIAAGPDGSVWALGRTDGKVYHLSPDLQIISEDTVSHPFGAASPLPPFQPVCRGIAFYPDEGALFVLNSSQSLIQEFSPQDGSPMGDPVQLQVPQGALLTSLCYDSDRALLWSVDSVGDRILGFDPATGELKKTLNFPGDDPPETYLYGSSAAYGMSGDKKVLYLLWGDIFQQDARTIKLIDPDTGAEDPFSWDLSDIGEGEVRSIAFLGDTLLILIRSEKGSTLVKIDSSRPSVVPPSGFHCQAQENGDVLLTWQNNGLGAENSYTEISILRDGTTVAQLPGSATSFLDESAPEGLLVYELRARWAMQQVMPVRCKLRNRRGALLSWRPFPGGSVSGIAVDPETGDLWVTDSKPIQTGKYLLWHLSPDMEVIENFEISSPGPPYGITFWPNADLGHGPETIILIANEGTDTVQRIRRDGTLAAGSVPVRLPEGAEGSKQKVGALAYDAANGEHFLAILDTGSNRIVWVDKYGFPPDPEEQDQGICVPLGTSGVVPAFGLAVSPQTGLIHTAIENGSIHELDRFCNVTPFDIDPYIPEGPLSSIRVKDFAYKGNAVYITSPATNSIFKVLAYPTGKPFIRADVNEDGKVDISDVISILQFLFEGGSSPSCLDRADANDDGRIDISDPVYLLFFLFDAGPPPPEPYPESGLDPTLGDDFTC